MNTYEIARIFGVSHVTVYRWAERGCPHTKEEQGTKVVMKFDPEEVRVWVKEQQKKYRK